TYLPPTLPPELYTLSLHDALPISGVRLADLPVRSSADGRATTSSRRTGARPPRAARSNQCVPRRRESRRRDGTDRGRAIRYRQRSEEHTSELQSRENLVCRLLLHK